ncbi:MAG TPA: MMPL family transporter, partial [Candidatus Saccharimonadales bacterium]|nr:MMPL family transporter [Candidatus Saccharimonadales bacterium]
LGFLVIVLFMVVLYGRLGILASCALVLYTLLVLVIFKLIPVTVTLAGIAGFILSIGMAVDANILIFERMKEELRLGKSHSIAIELGFSRAWTSIRDSNISTLITSFVLYKFGTGIVQGFALTLAIGVIVSMFSAIVVTRTLIRNFCRK